MPIANRSWRVWCNCGSCVFLPNNHPYVLYGLTLGVAVGHARRHGWAYPEDNFSYNLQPQSDREPAFPPYYPRFTRSRYPCQEADVPPEDADEGAAEQTDDAQEDADPMAGGDPGTGGHSSSSEEGSSSSEECSHSDRSSDSDYMHVSSEPPSSSSNEGSSYMHVSSEEDDAAGAGEAGCNAALHRESTMDGV